MTLTEFLLARIADDEDAANDPEWLAFEYGIDSGGRRAFVTRVLAECEAKRRIVEWSENGYAAHKRNAMHVLTLLALPYEDHADYQKEWKP